MKFSRYIFLCLITIAMMIISSSSWADQTPTIKTKIVISTQQETAQDIALAPCKNSERLEAAKALFIKLGASSNDIVVEKQDGVENLMIKKPGKSDETIVIGAHYDKVSAGCGAIDNWSGIVTIAHIYRSLKETATNKTLLFVAFGKEEEGLLGSKALTKTIKKDIVNQYCAMINVDSLGMAAPQTAENLSSKLLIDRSLKLAEKMKVPFNSVSIPHASADSVPFIEKKIPAITISALAQNWHDVLHSGNDQVDKVNSASLYYGYRLTLALVADVDSVSCQDSRDTSEKK